MEHVSKFVRLDLATHFPKTIWKVRRRVHRYYPSSSWVEVASLVYGMNEECNKGGQQG